MEIRIVDLETGEVISIIPDEDEEVDVCIHDDRGLMLQIIPNTEVR